MLLKSTLHQIAVIAYRLQGLARELGVLSQTPVEFVGCEPVDPASDERMKYICLRLRVVLVTSVVSSTISM